MEFRSVEEERLRDNQAHFYDKWYLERGYNSVEIEDDAILKALSLRAHDQLLDLGCGTGRLLEKMATQVKTSVGLDLSGKSIDILNAKKLPRTVGIRFDITKDKLSQLSGPFDKIVSVQMIQHLDPLVVPTVLGSIGNVLSDQGIFVLELYNFSGLNRKIEILRSRGKIKKIQNDGKDFFEYRYTPHEMAELFKKSGLQVIKIQGVCNLPRAIANRLGSFAFMLERMINKLGLGRYLGYYFIITAKKV